MILNENEKVNIITRALIFHKDHILITKWKDDFSFLIGGRVDFGEPIEESIIREIYEETKMKSRIKKLIYFNENIFHFHEKNIHEFAWYYLMEIEELNIKLNEIKENPDSSKLSIQFIPLNKLQEYELYPKFLVNYLERDYKEQFRNCPRHIYTNELSDEYVVKEMSQTLVRR